MSTPPVVVDTPLFVQGETLTADALNSGFLSKIAVVDNIAQLRMIDATHNTRVFVAGYWTPGDGGGGFFNCDRTDTTSTENYVNAIIGLNGAVWKFPMVGAVSVRRGGAKGDGSDDSVALQRIANLTTPLTVLSLDGVFRHTQTITFPYTYCSIVSSGRGTGLQFDPGSAGGIALYLRRTHDTILKYTLDSFALELMSSAGVSEGIKIESDAATVSTVSGEADQLILRDVSVIAHTTGVWWMCYLHIKNAAGVTYQKLYLNNHDPGAQTDVNTSGVWIERTDSLVSMIRTFMGSDLYCLRAYNPFLINSISAGGIESLYVTRGEVVGTAGAVFKVVGSLGALTVIGVHFDIQGKFVDGDGNRLVLSTFQGNDIRRSNNGSDPQDVPFVTLDNVDTLVFDGNKVTNYAGLTQPFGLLKNTAIGSYPIKMSVNGNTFSAFTNIWGAVGTLNGNSFIIKAGGNQYTLSTTLVYNWSSLNDLVQDNDAYYRTTQIVALNGTLPLSVSIPINAHRPAFFTDAPKVANFGWSSSTLPAGTAQLTYDYGNSNNAQVTLLIQGSSTSTGNFRVGLNAVY